MQAMAPSTASEARGMPPTPIWPASMQCLLCGGRRRDYLFVVGSARMTRCHDCGLVSRSGGGNGGPASYRLDADSAALVSAHFTSGRVLHVGDGGAAFPAAA